MLNTPIKNRIGSLVPYPEARLRRSPATGINLYKPHVIKFKASKNQIQRNRTSFDPKLKNHLPIAHVIYPSSAVGYAQSAASVCVVCANFSISVSSKLGIAGLQTTPCISGSAGALL